MDYLKFFSLSAEPFTHAPLPRFYYGSRQHTEALERLLYAVRSMRGLALLLGDLGHGKTTLARRLLDALPEAEYEAALLVIVHTGITANWLLKRIAIQLGVPDPADDKLTILSQLYQRLIQIHEAGRKAVVLIDEAQMLQQKELMEEFRGLLNLEVPGHKLITFVFFGLPELERNLALDPPLAQRVAMRCRLQPLGEEDTERYVLHRLALADAQVEIFPHDAIREIARWTKGIPRIINTVCDNLLLELFLGKKRVATPEMVAAVAENLGLLDDAYLRTPDDVRPPTAEIPAVEDGPGYDAIVALGRPSQAEETGSLIAAQSISESELQSTFGQPSLGHGELMVPSAVTGDAAPWQEDEPQAPVVWAPGDIAARVAAEPGTITQEVSSELDVEIVDPVEFVDPAPHEDHGSVDIEDPLAFLGPPAPFDVSSAAAPQAKPVASPLQKSWGVEAPSMEVTFSEPPAVINAPRPNPPQLAVPATPAAPAVREVKTSAGRTINLQEIDALLDDLV